MTIQYLTIWIPHPVLDHSGDAVSLLEMLRDAYMPHNVIDSDDLHRRLRQPHNILSPLFLIPRIRLSP